MDCGCITRGNPFDMNVEILEACVLHLAWAGGKLKEKDIQISVIRNYVNEEGVSDTAKVIRVQGVVNKGHRRNDDPAGKCEHIPCICSYCKENPLCVKCDRIIENAR